MTITEVRVRLVSLENATLTTSHGASVGQRAHLFVAVRDDAGREGVAEGSPLPAFTGERAAEMVTVVQEVLAPAMIGLGTFDTERISAALDRTINLNNTSKSALINAVFDLQAKTIGRPLGTMLGGVVQDHVSLAGVVGIGSTEETVRDALRLTGMGIRTVKLKVGADVRRDVDVVRSVRETVGDSVQIRADANGGYSLNEALRFLRSVEDDRLEYLEQPLPRHDLRGIAHIRSRTETPIAVDESLLSVQDALAIARSDAADVFVIKLMKFGGLHNARKAVVIAEAAGIACVTVSPYETSVGVSFNIHLAASSAAFRMASELGASVSRGELDGAEGLEYEPGIVRVPTAPGCGVRVPASLFEGS